jgi:hypothetical protein
MEALTHWPLLLLVQKGNQGNQGNLGNPAESASEVLAQEVSAQAV